MDFSISPKKKQNKKKQTNEISHSYQVCFDWLLYVVQEWQSKKNKIFQFAGLIELSNIELFLLLLLFALNSSCNSKYVHINGRWSTYTYKHPAHSYVRHWKKKKITKIAIHIVRCQTRILLIPIEVWWWLERNCSQSGFQFKSFENSIDCWAFNWFDFLVFFFFYRFVFYYFSIFCVNFSVLKYHH